MVYEGRKPPFPGSFPAGKRQRRGKRSKSVVNDDHRVSALLEQTSDAMLRVREKELAPAKISAIEAAVLFVLENAEKPTTPAEIARWILREPHSTSRLLQRMEAKGLVTKSKDLVRRNLVRISITARGRQAYEFSLKRESVYSLMSYLSDKEKQQLDALLRKLLNASLSELRIKRDVPYP
jgi:DNA-binding MarR family transcriptional regulator